MSDLELRLALQGDLEAWHDRSSKIFLSSLKGSLFAEGRRVQAELREDVVNAGLGQGIANAWRLEVYPAGGRLSWGPAAFLHSNAAHIVEAHTKGEPIAARGGGYIAVPIPGSPAYDMKVRKGGQRVAAVEKRFGPLRLVVTRRGLMLVGSGREKGGQLVPLQRIRHRESGAQFTPLHQRAVRAEIPMFWLVRQVRLQKRLHWPEIAAAAESRFARNVEADLQRRLGASSGGLNAAYGAAQRLASDEFLAGQRAAFTDTLASGASRSWD